MRNRFGALPILTTQNGFIRHKGEKLVQARCTGKQLASQNARDGIAFGGLVQICLPRAVLRSALCVIPH